MKHAESRLRIAGTALLMIAVLGCESLAGEEGGETVNAAPVAGQALSEAGEGPFAKPGFFAEIREGRLWVFRADDEELSRFRAGSEPAKHVTRIRVGPAGMTVKSPDTETVNEYLAAKEGFYTQVVDGRIWVFRPDSPELVKFRSGGEPAKHVTRISAGPSGMTVKAPDTETVDAYVCSKPGFFTEMKEGRLWVFREGDDELARFRSGGELAKHVTRVKAGPGGVTVKAPDTETLDAYMTARDGFYTQMVDGRLWVFVDGSSDLESFRGGNEPAKHVTRVKAGPGGVTVKAPDTETLDAYLASK
jgi:hypothetical protein